MVGKGDSYFERGIGGRPGAARELLGPFDPYLPEREAIELRHTEQILLFAISGRTRSTTTTTSFHLKNKKGFVPLFNGINFDGWTGNTVDYEVKNGEIVLNIDNGPSHGNLFTQGEYRDFTFRFEFQLTPGANNGLGIRAPPAGR